MKEKHAQYLKERRQINGNKYLPTIGISLGRLKDHNENQTHKSRQQEISQW